MRKLLTNTIALTLLSVSPLSANANDYTVQVGAYQALTNQAIRKAEQHGEVYQSIGNDNLTRLHVGRFTSKSDAINKRDQLRSSGYNDAFITQISVTSPANTTPGYNSPAPYQKNTRSHSSTTHSSTSNANKQYSKNSSLTGLSADEKSKAAFLDGQLRIHSNGQFYSLEQYRRLNN